MIATHTAQGDDPTGAQCHQCRIQRGLVAANLAATVTPVQGRPAFGARQWLGMETAVERVTVLGGAAVAQSEAIERRIRPIVGERANQRVARSALRAVNEGVSITPRTWIAQFLQTLIACEQVGRNMYLRLRTGRARQNAESFVRLNWHRLDIEQPRARRRWCAYQQRFPKRPKALSEPLCMVFDGPAVVAHPATELVVVSEAKDKG